MFILFSDHNLQRIEMTTHNDPLWEIKTVSTQGRGQNIGPTVLGLAPSSPLVLAPVSTKSNTNLNHSMTMNIYFRALACRKGCIKQGRGQEGRVPNPHPEPPNSDQSGLWDSQIRW